MNRVIDDREKVSRIVRKVLAIEEDNKDWTQRSFRKHYAANSLDLMTIVLDLQDEYDCEISDEEIKDLDTVEDIVAFIARKRADVQS